MARTNVKGTQVSDGSITRDDLNTATAGKAVITRLAVGDGLSISSSTGADTGTGNVVIGADMTYLNTQFPNFNSTKPQNHVFAAPGVGGNGTPAFRALVAGDIPALPVSGVTNLQTLLDAKISGSGTSGYLSKYTGTVSHGNSVLYETGGGNVAIGGTAASSKLSFALFWDNNNETVGLNFAQGYTSGGLPAYGIGFGPAYTEGYLTYRSGVGNGNAYGHKWFVNNVELMRLRGDGRLGLGTNLPAYLLDVNGTGRFTGNVTFASNIAVGTVSDVSSLVINKKLSGGATYFGVLNGGAIQADVTTQAIYNYTQLNTQAASFTLQYAKLFSIGLGIIGASSSITNVYGYHVESTLAVGTNNYAFISEMNAGTGRWNLYMLGTANNYLAGNVWIGTNSSTYKFDVNGTGHFSGNVTFDANAILATAPTTGSHLVNKTYADLKLAAPTASASSGQVVKYNGSANTWATLSTADLSDNASLVKYISNNGERGLFMYGDVDYNYIESFLYTNPDSGISLGLHGYLFDGTSSTKEYGIQLDTDGYLYHLRLDGTRSRLATVDMLGSGGGSGSGIWNGGSVSNDIYLPDYQKIFWNRKTDSQYTARMYSNDTPALNIQSQGSIIIGADKYLELISNRRLPGYGEETGVCIDGVIIDVQNASILSGGYAKFAVSFVGGPHNKFKLTLVAA
ncbi:hypothetical protein [Emticicia sp. 17c]|uniref:hypothetical protein n=1 Tax=Emticicia sp. 17c TaxID=3127704 RepID=UPI00301E39C0